MMNKAIQILRSDDNHKQSKLFGTSPIKHHFQGVFVMMIDLSELPDHTYFSKSGYLFVYMNETNKSCFVTYEKEILKDIIKDGYPIAFSICDSDSDDFKLLGNPYELNYQKRNFEHLLMQFDPLIVPNCPIFSYLDGFVYLFMKKKDFNKKNFKSIYMIVDQT